MGLCRACNNTSPRPLATTIPHFWRMVWDNKVDVIMMATELQEAGKPKCERYFPLPGRKLKYAGITISHVSAEQCQGYIRSQFQLKKDGSPHACIYHPKLSLLQRSSATFSTFGTTPGPTTECPRCRTAHPTQLISSVRHVMAASRIHTSNDRHAVGRARVPARNRVDRPGAASLQCRRRCVSCK